MRNFRFKRSVIQMLGPGNVEMIGKPECVGGGSAPRRQPLSCVEAEGVHLQFGKRRGVTAQMNDTIGWTLTSVALSELEFTSCGKRLSRKPSGVLNAECIFFIRYALPAGFTIDEIFKFTKIDRRFLTQIEETCEFKRDEAAATVAA